MSNLVENLVRGNILHLYHINQLTKETALEFVREYPALGNITLNDLLGFRPGNTVTDARAPDPNLTKTKVARQAYDEAVFDAIAAADQDKGIAAIAIRVIADGTPDQCRKSTARLMESGRVVYAGACRGTRYFVAPEDGDSGTGAK